jgi:RNA polymerase sigma factor (sigma-70 family)
MARATLGAAFGQLGQLFSRGTVSGLPDAQLLARYATLRDGDAFEALVVRHGPMVLATCRAVLRHEQDIEDTFQATFVVLARRAISVRAGDALGGWLHRVAYRASVKANIAGSQRRRRESETLAMEIPDRARPEPEPDLRLVVHEEIDRLPDSQRLPVVLCDLEGLSYEEAAHRLRWTVPTLRCRLAKARERLRGRLTRRGVTATAVSAALLSESAQATVPAAWARAAVAAATGGTSSVAVSAPAQSILEAMFMTKLKIVSAMCLVLTGLLSVGVLAVVAGRPDEPTPKADSGAAATSTTPRDEQPGSTQLAPTKIELRGRVVDPSGRDVAGATLRTVLEDEKNRPLPSVTSGSDGRFRMSVPVPAGTQLTALYERTAPLIIATAPGFGPGWITGAAFESKDGKEPTIRLVEAGPPLEGRIIDLEGRPVTGAKLRIDFLRIPDGAGLTAWLERFADRRIASFGDGLLHLPVEISAQTGPNGEVQIEGIGEDRIAEISVSGPAIATAQLNVMARDGKAVRVSLEHRPLELAVLPRKFEHVAAPTKPIVGVVRDKDTGRPITGVSFRAAAYDEQSLIPAPEVSGKTDAEGRYRIAGLPKATAYRLFVEPIPGVPYPKATLRVAAETPAFEPVVFDFTLKRGIVVRGRVIDKATGKPIWGRADAFVFPDNPHARNYAGYADSYPAYASIGEDGTYEVVTLPGRGIIAIQADTSRYRGGIGAESIAGFDRKVGAFLTLPQWCHLGNYHTLAEVNLDPNAESVSLDLQVDPGRTVAIHALDPEGRPIGGISVRGIGELFATGETERSSPTFEVHALDPSKPRRVTITHDERKLIGSVYLKGDEAGPITIQLQPWGTVVGRIVHDDGRPRGGVRLSSAGGSNPPNQDLVGILPRGDWNGGIPVGRDGRFRVEGLVPGLKYSGTLTDKFVLSGNLFGDVTVTAGEVKDLGDLKMTPLKAEGE